MNSPFRSKAEREVRSALDESMYLNGDKKRPRMEQKFVNLLLTVLLGLIGWLGNNLWNAEQDLQRQLLLLNTEIARNYMPREELQKNLDSIARHIDRITDEVNNRDSGASRGR